jgi:hypothetical protein
MTATKLIFGTFLILSFNGCAITSVKNRLYRDMALGAVVGAIAAQQKNENKQAYTAMYSGIGSALGAIISVNLNDPDSENLKLKNQVAKFEADLEASLRPKLEFTSSGMMNSKIPDKYKTMINPGEWRVYRLDQWVEDGENRIIHQDKMMELTPPSLKPMAMPTQTEDKK